MLLRHVQIALRKTKLELILFESGALYGHMNVPPLVNIVLNCTKH